MNFKHVDIKPDFYFESRLLLAYVLKKKLSYLFSHDDLKLSDDELKKFNNLINLRATGKPIAYIINSCGFWDLELLITEDVLIPRADTEILIEQVLKLYPHKNTELNVLDLGTGSGAIALALAYEYKKSNITATDLSPKALDIAKKNAVKNKIKNIKFLQGSWFDALLTNKDDSSDNSYLNSFDIICSNPPYIDIQDKDICEHVKNFEPSSALFSEDRGLSDLKNIINNAKDYLKIGGRLFLEHGYTQALEVKNIFINAGFKNIGCVQDLSVNDRISFASNL